MKKQEVGFSLLELISVVTIVAVASAISMPSILRAMQGYRLRAAAGQIEDAFHSAKFAAMQANATRKVFIDTSGKTVAVGATTSATAVALPNGVSFTAISVSAPTIVSSAATNAATIGGQQSATATAAISMPLNAGTTYELSFSSRGLPTGTVSNPLNPGTVHWVYLTNSNSELMAVTVTSAGSSQIWRWDGSNWVKG